MMSWHLGVVMLLVAFEGHGLVTKKNPETGSLGMYMYCTYM